MTTAAPLEPTRGVLVVAGYGLRVAVQHGHLTIQDGVGADRRAGRFSRIDRDLKRVVIIGHSGTITLDAISWLQGAGVPLVHLDHDGRLYFVSTPGALPVAQMRRMQARAVEDGVGLEVSRALLTAKMHHQRALLPELPDGEEVDSPIADLIHRAERAASLQELRACEARSSRAYWRAWRQVPIRFDPIEARRRPEHWRQFGTRISPLTDPSPRRAVTPANAVLNYLYAILEAEAVIAALAARLDPTMGVLHTDRPNRFSLACDLMEPVRPAVDHFALSLFRERPFTNQDVFELRDGQCRLLPRLTRQLAGTAALWAQQVRPVAEHVAKVLVTRPRGRRTIVPGVPMPLVGTRRPPRGRTSVVRGFDEETPAATWAVFEKPSTGWRGTVPLRRVFEANRAWDRQNAPADPARYRQVVLPGLKGVPIRVLVAATGLSTTTCHKIRRGEKVPHPRHWEPLHKLAGLA